MVADSSTAGGSSTRLNNLEVNFPHDATTVLGRVHTQRHVDAKISWLCNDSRQRARWAQLWGFPRRVGVRLFKM